MTYLPTSNSRLTVIHANDGGDLTEGVVAFHSDGSHLAIGFPGNITVWSLMGRGKWHFRRVTSWAFASGVWRREKPM